MANPYTTTITFAEETLGTGDTWQLVLTLSTALEGSNASIDAADQGLVITDHGKTTWDFDMNDLSLMPGEMKMSIADTSDYLHGFLFATTSIANATTKQFTVQIKLNGSIEFSGKALEDDVRYHMGTKLLTFSAASSIDELKNTALYDGDDVDTNPLSYADLTNKRKLVDIIDDIMKKIYPATIGTYYHDWTFRDEDLNDCNFEDIYAVLNTFYDNSADHLIDLTEVIKEIIHVMASRLIIVNENSYIIEGLGYYDAANTQIPTILDHVKEYRWAKLQYARFEPTETQGAFYPLNYGTPTNLESSKFEKRFILAAGYWGMELVENIASNIYNYSGGDYKRICWAIRGGVPGNLYTIAGAAYIVYRGDVKNMINHKFHCSGVDYVLNKTVLYDSGYYQINKMVKDWENETTDIEAIYCAAA